MFYLLLAISFAFAVSWQNLLAKVLFLDNFYPGWVNNGIVGVEWTIGVEMIFYLLAPFLYRRIRTVPAGALFFAFGIGTHYWIASLRPPSTPVDWNLYRAFSFPMHLHAFAMGIFIYHLFRFWNRCSGDTRKNLSDVCMILVGVILAFLMQGKIFLSSFVTMDFALLFFFLFFGSMQSRMRFLWVNPVTRFLGKISYSVYLWHLWVWYRLTTNFPGVDPNSLQALVVVVLATVGLSTVTYYLIEKPFIRWGNKLVAGVNFSYKPLPLVNIG